MQAEVVLLPPLPVGNPEISVVACTTNLRQWTENELPGTGSMQTFTGLDNGIAVASGGWERLNGGSYLTKVTRFSYVSCVKPSRYFFYIRPY